MENTVTTTDVEQGEVSTPTQSKTLQSKTEKKSGGAFRREMTPVVNSLLEDFDTAPLNINASKDLDKVSEDLVIISKALDELKKVLKTDKRAKPNSPIGSKLLKQIEKAISVAQKHDAEADDALKVLSAVRQATTKLNNHVSSLKVAKEKGDDKDRFSF